MAAIYSADIFCDDCADDIRRRIATELWESKETALCPDDCPVADFDDFDELLEYLTDYMDERNYDSDEFPKGCSDDEESDCPQHCGSLDDCLNPEVLADGSKVGHFFGNALTSYGDDYVKDAVNEDLRDGSNGVAVELWMPCYDYIDYDEQCATCGDYDALDENDECSDCADKIS